MKYPHIVIVDGVWYEAGAEVPETVSALSSNDDEAVAFFTEEDAAASVDEEDVEMTLTKVKLNKMKVEQLREVGRKYGLNSVEELSGTEIKRNLISLLKL